MVYTFNPSTQISQFESSLVYKMGSRAARGTEGKRKEGEEEGGGIGQWLVVASNRTPLGS